MRMKIITRKVHLFEEIMSSGTHNAINTSHPYSCISAKKVHIPSQENKFHSPIYEVFLSRGNQKEKSGKLSLNQET
jgi:hypothetical protein